MEISEVPLWWPTLPPIYDINKTYLENALEGPFMHKQPILSRIESNNTQKLDFLGFKINSPIGVPAGPLLNSAWTGLACKLGYDVVAYKTIRSIEFAGHSLPNMIYVDIPHDLKTTPNVLLHSTPQVPQDMASLAVTNSFGMPSRSRAYLEEDIPKANSLCEDGQVMIVSVVGTPSSESAEHGHANISNGENYTSLVRDFVDISLFAKKCGAKIIEANFSCPNVATGEGSIFQNPNAVLDIGSAITAAIGDTPLIIKVGTFQDNGSMTQVFKAAQQAKIASICGINSVSMKVVDPISKNPALGPNRISSGVCGGPIRGIAVDFIHKAKDIIAKEQLNLTLVGCGGITAADHFDEFLNAGATVAMSATGMLWDPYLALRYHKLHGKKIAATQ